MSVFACNWHPERRFAFIEGWEMHTLREHGDNPRDGWVMQACPACGVSSITTADSPPAGDRCMHCPGVQCADCGEPDDRKCSCWLSLEDMPLADIKALFARDAELSDGPTLGI